MSIGFSATVTGGHKIGMRTRHFLNLHLRNGYKVHMFYRGPVPLFFIDLKVTYRDEQKLEEYLRAQSHQSTIEPF